MNDKYNCMLRNSLGRSSCRWDDNIKVDRNEMLNEDVDPFYLTQDSDQWRTGSCEHI